MITVLFFAQTRELVGVDKLEVEAQFETAEALRHHLAEQGGKWALALKAASAIIKVIGNIFKFIFSLYLFYDAK